MIRSTQKELINGLEKHGLKFSQFEFTLEGDYLPTDADWNCTRSDRNPANNKAVRRAYYYRRYSPYSAADTSCSNWSTARMSDHIPDSCIDMTGTYRNCRRSRSLRTDSLAGSAVAAAAADNAAGAVDIAAEAAGTA